MSATLNSSGASHASGLIDSGKIKDGSSGRPQARPHQIVISKKMVLKPMESGI